jgi:ABC-2 type transport system ATP-binding protein
VGTSADEPVVRVRGLTKVYGARTAVDRIDLEVPAGTVFGLLGQNGAGKTTTIRMLLGLVAPTAGEVRLFGRDMPGERLALLPRIGCLVEGPAFYPYLTARKNLALLGALSGGVDAARVQACLERVGLGDRGDDLYRGFSTGMRQRLGIASALLHDPALVILDEPVNGLDPPAILLVRKLIRDLAEREGKTVLVSSHLLHEVEVSCDRVAIIEKGRVVAHGTIQELVRPDVHRVDVETPDTARAAEVARAVAGVSKVDVRQDGLTATLDGATSAQLNRALVEAGVSVVALVPRRRTLEELFHTLAGAPPPPAEKVEGAA